MKSRTTSDTAAAIPDDEIDRLAALNSTDLLDSLPEQEFDDIVKLAAGICGTNIGLISLVDKDRQWFKAKIGLEAKETPRDVSFCAHAVNSPHDIFVVEDASRDPRFMHNTLVTNEPHIRFYAGVPLIDESGYPLGTLCVIDQQPRVLDDWQISALKALTRQVSVLLSLRRVQQVLHDEIAQRKLVEAQLDKKIATVSDLVHNASDIIQSVAPSGEFLYVNAAWSELLGYSGEEALRMNVFDVIAEECKNEFMSQFESVMTGEVLEDIGVVFESKTGVKIEAIGHVSSRFEEGLPVSARGTFRILKNESVSNADLVCVCGWCSKVRDDGGQWAPFFDHFSKHNGMSFTHGICKDCLETAMPVKQK